MGEDGVVCCGDKDEGEREHGPPDVVSLIPLDVFGLAEGPSGSTSETGMGEVGVVCCGDKGEGEGEHGGPDGVSLVPLGVLALRCLSRADAALGTFAVPLLETLTRAKTGLVAPVSNAFVDTPQLCAPGSGKTITHASLSLVF